MQSISERGGGVRSLSDAELGAHAAEWLRFSTGRNGGFNLRDYDAPIANGVPNSRSQRQLASALTAEMKEERVIINRDLERLYPSSLIEVSMRALLLRVAGGGAGGGDSSSSSSAATAQEQPDGCSDDGHADSPEARARTVLLHTKVRRVLHAFQVRRRGVGYTQGMHIVVATLIRCCEARRACDGDADGGALSDDAGAVSDATDAASAPESSAEQDAFTLFCTLMEVLLPPDFLTPPPAAMNGLCTHTDVLEALVRLRFPKLALALDGPPEEESSTSGGGGFGGFSFSPVRMLVQVHTARCYVQLFADMVPLRTLLLIWDLLFSEDVLELPVRNAQHEGEGEVPGASTNASASAPASAPAPAESSEEEEVENLENLENAKVAATLVRMQGSAVGVPRRTSLLLSMHKMGRATSASSIGSCGIPSGIERSNSSSERTDGVAAEGRDVSSWGGGAGMTLLTTSMAIIHLNSAQIRKKGQFQPTLLMNAGRSADVASLAAALSYIELGSSPDTAVETAPPFDPRVALDSLSEHRRKRGAQWGLDPGQAVDDLHRSLSKKGSSYDAGTGVSNGGSGGGTFSLEMIHELQKAYQNMVGQGIAEGGMERLQFRELLTRTHSLTPAVDGMDIDVGKIADRLFDTCDDSRSGRIDFREVRFIF